MKLNKRNSINLVILLIIALMLSGCGSKDKSKTLRLGAGGIGGNYYNYGMNLSQMMADEDYSLEITATAGSAANLRLISQGYLELAMVQSDTLKDALEGKGIFEEGALKGFHSVTGLYQESCQIIVSKDSDIKTVDDLTGKTVSIGAKESGVLKNAEDILNAYGMSVSDISPVYAGFADSAKALEEGQIDAFFCTSSAPTTAIVELSQNMDIRLLPVSLDVTKSLLSGNSAYSRSVIPAGTYEGQEEDISTIGVTAVLIASDGITKEAEDAIKTVLEKQNSELQEISFGVAPVTEKEKGNFKIDFDMYQTLALAVMVLFLGGFLRKKVRFLETFCIPSPVIGGLLFAIISCVLYVSGLVEFSFDETLKNVCMVMFFTSVGFQANLKVLKSGGKGLVIFLFAVAALIVCQNGLAIGLSKMLGVDPLVGLCTGSIPMVGGHGTAGAFGAVLEDLGLESATTLATAAATFGLIMGSLMGGPIGRRLILKHDLLKTAVTDEDASVLIEDEEKHHRRVSMYAPAAYQLAIAMGIGTIVSVLLSKTGMTFPVYIGAMIVAAVMRNTGEYTGKFNIHMGEINDIGGICLSLFLGIAMITLKLWQLAALALPLFVLLLSQTLFMAVFAYFVVYNIMGRNYDAAVLSAGTCGFGMGATPNAMANMQAITEKFAPSVKAYILVPIVGSMFADFINSLVITFFINLL